MPPPPLPSTFATAPSPTSDEATLSSTTHRRIDLQSPLDLTYLHNNARAAARAKIDLHLPLQTLGQIQTGGSTTGAGSSSGGVGDEMRRSVEKSVDEYLEDTFGMVRRNVVVNGIDGETVRWGDVEGVGGPEEYEPHNPLLASRITTLHSAIETLNLQLANTRREAAALAASQYREAFTSQNSEIDEALDGYEATLLTQVSEEGEEGKLGDVVAWRGREEEVMRIWEEALERLGALNADGERGLAGVKSKAEEAQRVVEYLEGR